MSYFLLMVMFMFLTGIYMLPWIISVIRDSEEQDIIFLLNLLLGWSYYGWIFLMAYGLLTKRKTR